MYHHILGSFVDVLAFFIELFILFIQEDGYSKKTSFGNSAVIKLDELHDFIPSYLTAIGCLTWWCEEYRLHAACPTSSRKRWWSSPHPQDVLLSSPLGGVSFPYHFMAETFTQWDSVVLKGTFEMKSQSCPRKKNYMSGENVKILPFKKNYNIIAPQGDVRKVRLGLYSFQEAFEVIYKCRGETIELRNNSTHFSFIYHAYILVNNINFNILCEHYVLYCYCTFCYL